MDLQIKMATQSQIGIVRVGIYNVTNLDNFKDYKPVIVMTKSYGDEWTLSPFHLKDENGYNMENIWQFSKVYENVPKMSANYWTHNEEQHYDKDKNMILPAYWNWRKKGFSHNIAVRYPVGFHNRNKCLFSVLSPEDRAQKVANAGQY